MTSHELAAVLPTRTAMTTTITKAEIRDLLRGVSHLGDVPASVDDAELGLDSITMIWVITQLQRRTGLTRVQDMTADELRSVNTIHRYLTDTANPLG
jgi:acyl carrier protein